jgi:hypothetical protein
MESCLLQAKRQERGMWWCYFGGAVRGSEAQANKQQAGTRSLLIAGAAFGI